VLFWLVGQERSFVEVLHRVSVIQPLLLVLASKITLHEMINSMQFASNTSIQQTPSLYSVNTLPC
jgi:hypothetical protein